MYITWIDTGQKNMEYSGAIEDLVTSVTVMVTCRLRSIKSLWRTASATFRNNPAAR